MNLLFLLTQSLDYPSGLGRYWPLARELARLGYGVRVAALHPALASASTRAAVRDGVDVRYVGPMHVRQVGHERLYYGPAGLAWAVARGAWGLAWQGLLAGVDAVHVCKPHPMNGLAGLLAARLRGRRLYLDCDDYEAGSNRFGGGWQRRVVETWEDGLPRQVRAVTVNTRFMQRRLVELGLPAERLVYVPNGIDRRRFAGCDPARAGALRAEMGLGDSPTVLYVGSLSIASHPIGLLLEAFGRVLAELPTARLVIVGGGEDYAAVGRRVQEAGLAASTIMTGRVEPERIVDYYMLGDVAVDPVHGDEVAAARSPLKLFEAMACGVPMVTGDVGERCEQLGGGEAGLAVAPGSAAALADGLLGLLADPGRRRTMGERGRLRAERYYWDVQVREFARVYEL